MYCGVLNGVVHTQCQTHSQHRAPNDAVPIGRVSLVDDYGEGLAMPEEGLEWWQPPEEDAAMYASDDEGAFEWVEAVVA